MSYSKNTLVANATWTIYESGRYFRIMTSTGAVNISFFKNGSLVNSIDNVLSGFWRESVDGEIFDKVVIKDISALSNVIEVVIDDSRVGYDRMAIAGTINANITNQKIGGTFTRFTPAIAAGVVDYTALPAKTNRRSLVIINNMGSLNIKVFLHSGAVQSTVPTYTILPGVTLSLDGFMSLGAIGLCHSSAAGVINAGDLMIWEGVE